MLAQSWALLYESGVMIEKESEEPINRQGKVFASVRSQLQLARWARSEVGGVERARM